MRFLGAGCSAGTTVFLGVRKFGSSASASGGGDPSGVAGPATIGAARSCGDNGEYLGDAGDVGVNGDAGAINGGVGVNTFVGAIGRLKASRRCFASTDSA